MSKRIYWVVSGCLLMAALVLASCTSESSSQKQGSTGEDPVYGGALTILHHGTPYDYTNFDMQSGKLLATLVLTNSLDTLLKGDIQKYGTRGTNEFAFQLFEFIPEQYLGGSVAESWEVTNDPLGVTFKIRPGVMWTGNANIGMEPREVTAEDIAVTQIRLKSMSGYETRYEFIESITAPDKYTLVYEFNRWEPNWAYHIAWGAFPLLMCPEVVDSEDPTDWRNSVGSGPFILTDYVEGSSVEYKRNPIYWRKATINGKEYETPFIDTLLEPIIPDESTRVAALRTGKADLWNRVPMLYEETLADSSPDLIKVKFPTGQPKLIGFNTRDGGLMADKKIRHALMVGTDLEALNKAANVEGVVYSWPFQPALDAAFTPMKELPAETQRLFEYDPDRAKQMLADAGYPDGFAIEMVLQPTQGGTNWQEDVASALVSYWGALGVDVELLPKDNATWVEQLVHRKYKDVIIADTGNNNPYMALQFGANSELPRTRIDDDYVYETYQKIIKETSFDAQMVMAKELGPYLTDYAASVSIGTPFLIAYHWPWVKNYSTELEGAFYNISVQLALLWFDQDLKKEMGY